MFKTMEDIKRANVDIGDFWFSPSTMSFFASKIEPGLMFGRFFVTSEKGPTMPRLWSVRRAAEPPCYHVWKKKPKVVADMPPGGCGRNSPLPGCQTRRLPGNLSPAANLAAYKKTRRIGPPGLRRD